MTKNRETARKRLERLLQENGEIMDKVISLPEGQDKEYQVLIKRQKEIHGELPGAIADADKERICEKLKDDDLITPEQFRKYVTKVLGENSKYTSVTVSIYHPDEETYCRTIDYEIINYEEQNPKKRKGEKSENWQEPLDL